MARTLSIVYFYRIMNRFITPNQFFISNFQILKNLKSWILAFLLLNAITGNAQRPLGLVTGDYNQPYGQFLNPAEIRSPLHKKLFINWYGNSIQYSNNFMQQGAPYKQLGRWGTPTAGKQGPFEINYLNESYGFSMTLPLDNVAGLTFGFRGVSGYSVNGLSADLGNIIATGRTFLSQNVGKSFETGPFSFNTEKYQEYYMGFGSYAMDKNDVIQGGGWRWGATAKLLIGNGSMSLNGTQLDYTVQDPFSVNINAFEGNFQFSDPTSVANTLARPWGMKFDYSYGAGAGMDLGFIYESRPKVPTSWPSTLGSNCDKDKFMMPRWKFGVSLSDLGFISYDGEARIIKGMNRSQNWRIDSIFMVNQPSHNNTSIENKIYALDNSVFQQVGIGGPAMNVENTNNFVTYTPAALNFTFDFRFNTLWHVSSHLTRNIKPEDAPGLRRTSYFSVIPRYETQKIEYGFPLTALGDNYDQAMVGAYVRYGAFTIGTNDLAGLGKAANRDGINSGSFYVALRSRIGDCGKNWSYYEREDTYGWDSAAAVVDSAMIAPDEAFNRPTKKDTVFVEKLKRDTITVRDTIRIKEPVPAPTEALKKLQACETAKTEALKAKTASDIALTEARVRATEAEKKAADAKNTAVACQNELVTQKEKCKNDLMAFQTELFKTKALLDAQQKNNTTLAEENARITAKLDQQLAENDRLKKSQGVPCDKQTKTLDSLLAVERLKNQQLAADLAKAKSTETNATIKAVEQDRKLLDLERKLLELEKQKSACDARVADLLNQLNSANSQVAVNKKCCDDKTNEVNAEKSKNAALLAEIQTLKNQVAALTSQKTALENQIKTQKPCEDCTPYKTRITALEKELATAKGTISMLEERLKNQIAGEDCTPYKTKVAQLEKDLTTANAKITAMVAEKKACEDKLTAANNTITSLKSTITALQNEKKACEDKLAAQSGTSTGEDCTPYKNRIAELEKQLATTKSQLDAEVLKTKALEQKLLGCIDKAAYDKALADLEACKKNSADLESRLKASESAKNAAQSELSAAKSKIAELEEKLKNCGSTTNCDDLKAQLEQLKMDLESKQNAYNALKAEYDDCLQTSKSLRSQLKECQDKLSASSGSSSTELQAAKDEIAKLKNTISQLNGEIAAQKKTIDELNILLTEKESQNTQLTQQVIEKNQQLSNLQTRLKQMEAQLNDCNAKLKKCLEAAAPPAPAEGTGG